MLARGTTAALWALFGAPVRTRPAGRATEDLVADRDRARARRSGLAARW
jgi:hypothetical protein